MENKNEPNPDWIAAPLQVSTLFGIYLPRGLSRKRRRHWKRQAVRRQIQAWSIDFAIGKDQNVTKWIRIGEQ